MRYSCKLLVYFFFIFKDRDEKKLVIIRARGLDLLIRMPQIDRQIPLIVNLVK
jgi:hypothetical protein